MSTPHHMMRVLPITTHSDYVFAVAGEGEAMPAHILRQLLRDYVEQFLPSGALRVAKVSEEDERRTLLEMAAQADGAR